MLWTMVLSSRGMGGWVGVWDGWMGGRAVRRGVAYYILQYIYFPCKSFYIEDH